MEKTSNQHLRLAKVQKLREKIISEIEGFSNCHQENLRILCLSGDNKQFSEYYRRAAKVEVELIYLKQYVNSESFFMDFVMRDEVNDITIYVVPDKHLDMYLEDEFLFTFNFLSKISNIDIWNLNHYLNDKFFAFHFISTFEEVLYDKKIKEAQ